MKHVVTSYLSLLLIVVAGSLIAAAIRHTLPDDGSKWVAASVLGAALTGIAFLLRLRQPWN